MSASGVREAAVREKLRRILELVRSDRLDLDDAAPLLAALSPRLSLTAAERGWLQEMLGSEAWETEQIAEHLLLLRPAGSPPPPLPPAPPEPPQGDRSAIWSWGPGGPWGPGGFWGEKGGPGRGKRHRARSHPGGWLGDLDRQIAGTVEQAVRGSLSALDSLGAAEPPARGGLLSIAVRSAEGDTYQANLPTALAPHLHKLIPPHGVEALGHAGFSLEGLQLLLEAQPAPGVLIDTRDSEGNSVQITLK